MQSIMCSVNDDAPRFVTFFEDKIKSGAIKHFVKTFNKTKGSIQLLADEKKEAKAEKAKMQQAKAAKTGGNMDDLEKMILAKRGNAFGGFLNYMEDKYGEKPNKKRKAAEVITESKEPAKRKKK